jgi:hypothetical protein
MSISKLVKAACMAVATLGLSACSSTDDGTVIDTLPSAFIDCNLISEGEHLSARAVVDETDLIVTVSSGGDGTWLELPTVTGVMGATLEDVASGQDEFSVNVRLTLATPDTMSGSFVFQGLLDSPNGFCNLERSFSFIIGNDHVEVAKLESLERLERELPLSAPSAPGRAALAIARHSVARRAILLSAARPQMPVVPS